MQVETYEIEEQGAGAEPEVESDKPRGDHGATRFQYPEMTAQEIAVYTAIFPVWTNIKSYSASIIPVRVLQVAAHAMEFCDVVEVWHKRIHDGDPLLVGVRKGVQSWEVRGRYRLARWGDALKDFSELTKEAATIVRDRMRSNLEECAADVQAKLAALDSLVSKKLRGEHIGSPMAHLD